MREPQRSDDVASTPERVARGFDVTRPWTPILAGEDYRAARAATRELATALAAIAPQAPGLAQGATGMALFFAYYGDVTGEQWAYDHATQLLEQASARIDEELIGVTWSTGIAGIGWVLEYLVGDQASEDDPNRGFDAAILRRLADPANAEYDLIGGLAGIAVYALGRIPRASAQAILERIVAEIDRRAVPCGTQRTWLTPVSQLPTWQRRLAPDGYFNLGLAHGVPALIAVLGRCVSAGIAVDIARPLLDRAVEWLLAQRLEGTDARFPGWIAVGAESSGPSRSAWCYGDPGVACGLMTAAIAAKEPAWEREAVELVLGVARRDMKHCGVVDAGLCHGAVGLALILARFFHMTGISQLETRAREWVRAALAMRRNGPIAGFQSYEGADRGWIADPGFLTGVAGVGLGLLAATAEHDPSWDAVLMLPSGIAR